MKPEIKIVIILIVLVVIGGAILFFVDPQSERGARIGGSAETGERYREIADPSGFVNTDPITIGSLVGKKVILVDFMTYSCINCQRTFPYLNAWYEKYKDNGLEIVGIHTPEFAFEKDIDNVRKAMMEFGIRHPVVLDNDYATWRAYGNRYWPRKYLIDIHGNIVYDHIGEGAYEETEMKIIELLEERARTLGESADLDGTGLVAQGMPIAGNFAKSPETYFGSLRNALLANGRPYVSGQRDFVLPTEYVANKLYLGGVWNISEEYAESVTDSRLTYKYFAKQVYIVAEADGTAEIEIWQDGKLIETARGSDVDANGVMSVSGSRLYKIINNPTAGEHLLELRVKSGKVRLFAFTFG